MRQIASERLSSSEHPKFSADRVDELGPNHRQRTETPAWSRNRLGNKAEGITIGTALQPIGFTARRELRGSR